jgi:hypothetical protein
MGEKITWKDYTTKTFNSSYDFLFKFITIIIWRKIDIKSDKKLLLNISDLASNIAFIKWEQFLISNWYKKTKY